MDDLIVPGFKVALTNAAQHPVAVYLARLAPNSRRTMQSSLRAAIRVFDSTEQFTIETFPWHTLRYAHVAAMRAALAAVYKPKSAGRHMAAVHGVLKEAWRLGLLSQEDYARAIDHSTVRFSSLPAGRALSSDELRKLIGSFDGSISGRRNVAIISILYGGMLRRSELVNLDLEHYSRDLSCLRILGKGQKERLVYLPAGAVAALEDWLRLRGNISGPLFYPVDQAQTVITRRLSTCAIAKLCARLVNNLGLEKFTPHDFRRTGISDLLDKGADLSLVSKLVGHSNPQTTTIYDRRPNRALQEAAEKLSVPYLPKESKK